MHTPWWPFVAAAFLSRRSWLDQQGYNHHYSSVLQLVNPTDKVKTVYCSSDDTKIAVVDISTVTGELIQVRQLLDNAPNPDNLKAGGGGGVATEWISLHPNKQTSICFAITSYGKKQPALLVKYRIKDNGLLERLESMELPGCYQACHASFSPDGSTYVVSSLLSGSLHFLDCEDLQRTSLQQVIILPKHQQSSVNNNGPMCHQTVYSPNGKYLIAVDVSQAQLLTFSTCSKGRVLSSSCITDIQTNLGPFGITSWLLSQFLKGPRPRHVAIHPNGKFLYVTLELFNVLVWYEIDENGIIGTKLGEQFTLSPEYYSSNWIGLSLNAVAEVALDEDGSFLYVSNRGLGWGRMENSVASYSVDEITGTPTRLSQISVSGNPRHFHICPDDDRTLIAAGCDTHLLHTIQRQSNGTLSLLGVANIQGMPSIGCIAISSSR